MSIRNVRKFLGEHVVLRRSLAMLAGGSIGFAYYTFIGCAGGTCPITGNPYISTLYGAGVGFLLTTGRKSP
jgi:hypothetical protein